MAASFDQFMDSAGRVAGSAVRGAERLVVKGRDKASQMALQARLAKMHRQLGALVYALRKNGETSDEMIDWYIREIDRIKAKISSYDAPAKEERTVFTSSGTEGDDEDAMFCGGAGK